MNNTVLMEEREIRMKQVVMMFCILLAMGVCTESATAATGKCTVVKVDGTKMVIECNEPTKGFAKGNQIKIKTDKKTNNQGQ